MHELSIAESIVGIAAKHAAERRVTAVDVKVGHLRQVVPSALEFAFELLTAGTELEGAELRIEEVPAVGMCRACGATSVLTDFPFTCSGCGGVALELISGRELLVDSLEVEEAAQQALTARMER